MSKLISILLYIWQLPQNLLGLLLRLFYKTNTVKEYRGKNIRVCHKFPGGISLGETIIVGKYPNNQKSWNIVKHEYGHSIQSKWLGPFYLIIVGIPSAVWGLIYNGSEEDYNTFFTERWADELGGVEKK